MQTSGAACREIAYVRHRPRRRTIQYSEALVMEPKGRGVLDARLRGHDGGRWRIVIVAMTDGDLARLLRGRWV